MFGMDGKHATASFDGDVATGCGISWPGIRPVRLVVAPIWIASICIAWSSVCIADLGSVNRGMAIYRGPDRQRASYTALAQQCRALNDLLYPPSKQKKINGAGIEPSHRDCDPDLIPVVVTATGVQIRRHGKRR
jgi:hypothetical protein